MNFRIHPYHPKKNKQIKVQIITIKIIDVEKTNKDSIFLQFVFVVVAKCKLIKPLKKSINCALCETVT